MKTTSCLLLAGLLVSSFTVRAADGEHRHGVKEAMPGAVGWTTQPLLLPGGGRGERSAALVRPSGIAAPSLSVFAPAGGVIEGRKDFPVDVAGARISPAAPTLGNYHWVVMREETPERVKVASTAWYFSNPGPAPTALLAEAKHELEIVPDPLPREHGSYRESEKWRFLVRLNGMPLAGQPLTLETEFGSRSTFTTDAAGYATVLFPRDFPSAAKAPGGHGRPSAGFVLTTSRESAGRRYLTAFNLSYGPDADRERSLAWGAAFGLFGMLAASPLLRRRRQTADGDVDHA